MGRAAGHGRPLWIMGHTDLHPRPQRRRVEPPWVIKGALDSEAFAAGRLTEEADAVLIGQSRRYYSLEA